MRTWAKNCSIAAAAASATALVFSIAGPRAQTVSAQTQATSKRLGTHPNFNGVWQTNNTANWDLQTHEPRPMVGQPGFTANSTVLAAPVVALGAIGWVPAGQGV